MNPPRKNPSEREINKLVASTMPNQSFCRCKNWPGKNIAVRQPEYWPATQSSTRGQPLDQKSNPEPNVLSPGRQNAACHRPLHRDGKVRPVATLSLFHSVKHQSIQFVEIHRSLAMRGAWTPLTLWGSGGPAAASRLYKESTSHLWDQQRHLRCAFLSHSCNAWS